MAPTTNGRVIFNEIPTGSSNPLTHRSFNLIPVAGFPDPGKTVVYDSTPTLDPDAVALPPGGFLLKTLYLSIDPYMRG